MKSIDLNADMGEGTATDAELMTIISSASIACGGHAGDAATMHETLLLAKEHDVAVGAHPGFADKENFGRVRLDLPHIQIAALVSEQVQTLLQIAASVDVKVHYVKLHGALANMAAENEALAEIVFHGINELDDSLSILALDNSAQVTAAKNLGMRVVREAYADRRYDDRGLLVSRDIPGAVLTDISAVLGQCLRLAKTGEIIAASGTVITSRARSLCLHGDTPGAVALATHIAEALDRAGITIASAW
jgi:5-oxoprolinase (ATP-hydrolysing) subunit A